VDRFPSDLPLSHARPHLQDALLKVPPFWMRRM
jgi:hypothetical protein